MAKVLRDIRVLDMGTFITGPAAGMLLGDLGADVIKIEHPDGDPFRHYKGGLYSPHFQTYNRNKRSITLNTKQAGDLAALDRLVAEADVFIQNFRPGVAERLGVGPADLRAVNPRLVVGSISGYGGEGPWVDLPGQDLLAQALSGVMWLNGSAGDGPVPVGLSVGDMLAGHLLVEGILAALVRRGISGGGATVETSLLEALVDFWVVRLEAAAERGELAPGLEIRPLGEWIVRLTFSFALMPPVVIDLGDEAAVRTFVRTHLRGIVT